MWVGRFISDTFFIVPWPQGNENYMKKKYLRAALESLKKERRLYTVGFNAQKNGYQGAWIETAHKKYLELTEAINAVMKELGE